MEPEESGPGFTRAASKVAPPSGPGPSISHRLAYDRLLDALRQRGCTVKASGTKATAHCPAHEDRGPSLSITGLDGRVLVHCFAGCEPAAVTDALSLPLSALYDDDTGDAWTPTTRNWTPRPAPNPLRDAEHWCARALQQTRLDADPAWQARRADELATARAARPQDFEGARHG